METRFVAAKVAQAVTAAEGVGSADQGLTGFVADGATAWHREPVPLPVRLTTALRCSTGVAAVTALVMGVAATSPGFCRRGACVVASFGGHSAVLAGLAGAAAVTLLVLAFVTAGFTRAGGPALGLLGLTALLAWTTAIGLIAVLLIALTLVALVIAVLLAVAGAL